MTYALGIDVGTTFTAAAVWRDGVAKTVQLSEATPVLPSVLFLRDDGALLVGEAAVARAVDEPDRVARGFKRRIADPVPYLLGDEPVTAQELTSDLIRWVLQRVVATEGGPPAYVTLTCPAEWDQYRRDQLSAAAGAAGLAEVGLLVEPIAAVTYSAAREHIPEGARVAVYDLGGGTFDAAVIAKTAGGVELLGKPGGLDDLGGMDFDEIVYDHLARSLGRRLAALDATSPDGLATLAGLRAAAVLAKEALSRESDVAIPVSISASVPNGPSHDGSGAGYAGEVRLTRQEFEDALRLPLSRTVGSLRDVLDSADVSPAALHSVLLVGGSSRIPLVSRLLVEELGVRIDVDEHPKFAVCLGAAVAAGARLVAGTHAARTPAPIVAADPTSHSSTPPRPPNPPAPVRQPAAVLPQTPTPASVRSSAAQAALLAPPPTRPVRMTADLAAARLTEPADVPLHPAVATRRTPVLDRDEPLVARLADDDIAYAGTARRHGLVVGASVLTALLLVGGVAWAVADSANESTTPDDLPSTSPAEVTFGRADLTLLGDISEEPGAYVREVTRTPQGVWLAAGGVREATGNDAPCIWRSTDGRSWTAESLRTTGVRPDGAALGIGAVGGEAVAAGWVTRNVEGVPTRVAAFWTSGEGSTWNLRYGAEAGLPSGKDLREATDVLGNGGGFLATAVDVGVTQDGEGDAVLLESAGGGAWTDRTTEGLSGRGPQEVRRVVRHGADLWAVGIELVGGNTGPALWRSSDNGATWSPESPPASGGTGAPDITGLAFLDNGNPLAVGTRASANDDTGAVWQRRDGEWKLSEVIAKDSVVGLSGVLPEGDTMYVAGSRAVKGKPTRPAMWRMTLRP